MQKYYSLGTLEKGLPNLTKGFIIPPGAEVLYQELADGSTKIIYPRTNQFFVGIIPLKEITSKNN